MVVRFLALLVALAFAGGAVAQAAGLDDRGSAAATEVLDGPTVSDGVPLIAPVVVTIAPPISAVVDVVHAHDALTPRLHVTGLFRPPRG